MQLDVTGCDMMFRHSSICCMLKVNNKVYSHIVQPTVEGIEKTMNAREKQMNKIKDQKNNVEDELFVSFCAEIGVENIRYTF